MSVARICVCCGKKYEYCPSCKKNSQPGWMFTYCSESCKGLFNIISAYISKRVSKEAVQAYIAEHNITDFTEYTEPVKKILNEATYGNRTPLTRAPLVGQRTIDHSGGSGSTNGDPGTKEQMDPMAVTTHAIDNQLKSRPRRRRHR